MPALPDRNFFALVSDADRPILRIPITRELQTELSTLFSEQKVAFFDGQLEEVAFDGRLVPDESQILVIDNFAVPQEILTAVTNPTSLGTLRLRRVGEQEIQKIRAIFTGSSGDQP